MLYHCHNRYELHTGGATPYMHLKKNAQVAEAVNNGYRLPMPAHCSVAMYEMMRKCWDTNPETRPTAADLLKSIPKVSTNVHSYCGWCIIRNFHLHDVHILNRMILFPSL